MEVRTTPSVQTPLIDSYLTDARVYESTTGVLHARYAGGGVQFEKIVGEIDATLGRSYLESLEFAMARAERICIVSDWSEVTRYSSETRSELTSWARGRIAAFEQAHIYTTRTLVAMGLSVARLAVPFIECHTQLTSFEAALASAAMRARSAGN